jgi:hypothetical protein
LLQAPSFEGSCRFLVVFLTADDDSASGFPLDDFMALAPRLELYPASKAESRLKVAKKSFNQLL